ncbi:hypothetical protein NDU88_003628 [Pleurodeles waltl]|uniref:Uncharacterized protein n=1 Tax=Pleurodeles waltl TaxID=8319 RepID=A0AAV7NJU0_PLEWA|nr:hypothetical protein NDU88_003628 [Pleurodeles waltl]
MDRNLGEITMVGLCLEGMDAMRSESWFIRMDIAIFSDRVEGEQHLSDVEEQLDRITDLHCFAMSGEERRSGISPKAVVAQDCSRALGFMCTSSGGELKAAVAEAACDSVWRHWNSTCCFEHDLCRCCTSLRTLWLFGSVCGVNTFAELSASFRLPSNTCHERLAYKKKPYWCLATRIMAEYEHEGGLQGVFIVTRFAHNVCRAQFLTLCVSCKATGCIVVKYCVCAQLIVLLL